jgi:23S rRNA pseudouridine955/2504/2580 synthase
MEQELIAGTDDSGRRLDQILRRVFPDMPLSLIYRLLRKGRVWVDGIPGDAAMRIVPGARIRIREEAVKPEKKPGTSEGSASRSGKWFEPTSGKWDAPASSAGFSPKPDILWEGAGILILNKPAGIGVHSPDRRSKKRRGSARQDTVCLDTLVQDYLRDKLPPSLSFKPGPLHRLDQVSSGVIVFSTSLTGARVFSAMMRERRLQKIYLALTDGLIEKPEVWEDTLFRDTNQRKTLVSEEEGNRTRIARTRVFPLAVHPPYSLIALKIETGLTHQIRSQAAFHGHPLAGDVKYGGSFQPGGPLLHALSLEFPGEGPVPEELRGKTIKAPLPERFSRRIREIFGIICYTITNVPEFFLDPAEDKSLCSHR